MKKIGIITPGGDAPGMNTAIATILRFTRNNGETLIGINDGYNGLIKRDFFDFSHIRSDVIMGLSGTILHSTRMPSFEEEKVIKTAGETLIDEGIEGLIVIGGDGSFKGAMAINKHCGIPTVGIPATIDNDVFGTDETIGFDTACNTAIEAINKIKDTAISFERIFVVEVMGKKRGFIALEVGIACGAEAILIPEVEVSISEIVKGLKREREKGQTDAIIVVAEGFPEKEKISSIIEEKTGCSTRRSVLGYIQRGGSPTRRSRMLAVLFASYAYELIKKNPKKPMMVGLKGEKIIKIPLEESVNGYKEIDLKRYELHRLLSNIY
ncbi:MAG: ATP-dependent 6-phosphofructokinase [candidate division WOR-3 bacterium]